MRNLLKGVLLIVALSSFGQGWDTTTAGQITYSGELVGIGTANPSSLLDLKQAGTSGEVETFLLIDNLTQGGVGLGTSIDFQHRTATNVKRIAGRIATINESSFSGSHNNDAGLAFYTMENAGSYERIRIDHRGYLGLDISNPLAKLHINGQGGGESGFRVSNSTEAVRGYFNTNNGDDNFIITYNNTGGAEIELQADGNVILAQAGNVGMGTTSPTEKLVVNGNIGLDGSEGNLYQIRPSQNSTSGVAVRPTTNPTNGDNIFTVESTGSSSRFGVTQSHGAWLKDGLRIGTQYNSGMQDLQDGLIVDGNVGIGTTNPTEKLEVAGTIYSREVKVEVAAGTGPDYVFEPFYNLRTLEETEAYIQANKHLPEIPSAKEMEANGVQLGEMNMLLLKKIEELTLHLIKANKTSQQQMAKAKSQDKKIEELTLHTIAQQKEIDRLKNSPRQPQAATPLFSKRGEETEGRRGELEKEAKYSELENQLAIYQKTQEEMMKIIISLKKEIATLKKPNNE